MSDMVLVPREPTPEMLEAAKPWPVAWGDYDNASPVQRAAYHADQATAASTYRAMLSAAITTPPEGEG